MELVDNLMKNINQIIENILHINFIVDVLKTSIGGFIGGYLTISIFKRQEQIKIREQLKLEFYKRYKLKYNEIRESLKKCRYKYRTIRDSYIYHKKDSYSIYEIKRLISLYNKCIELQDNIVDIITKLEDLNKLIIEDRLITKSEKGMYNDIITKFESIEVHLNLIKLVKRGVQKHLDKYDILNLNLDRGGMLDLDKYDILEDTEDRVKLELEDEGLTYSLKSPLKDKLDILQILIIYLISYDIEDLLDNIIYINNEIEYKFIGIYFK